MIASLIDLNTLDNLSRTCHQIRENLLQFRSQLIVQTLHCCNEDVEPNHDHTLRYRARAADWYFMEEGGVNVVGKVGNCARDMVAECRRCKRVVCRVFHPALSNSIRHTSHLSIVVLTQDRIAQSSRQRQSSSDTAIVVSALAASKHPYPHSSLRP